MSALQHEHKKWRTLQAQFYKQYSRVKKLSEKDNNTKYFHTIANMNKKRNMIRRIKVGGSVIKGVTQIREGIRDFFKSSFQQHASPYIHFDQGVFKQFHLSTVTSMELIPSEDEIKGAIWSSDPHKSHGYDSFNLNFIWKCWGTVGEDIIKFTKSFSLVENFQPL